MAQENSDSSELIYRRPKGWDCTPEWFDLFKIKAVAEMDALFQTLSPEHPPILAQGFLDSNLEVLYNKVPTTTKKEHRYYAYVWWNEGIEHYTARADDCTISLPERHWYLSGRAVPLDSQIYRGNTYRRKERFVSNDNQYIAVFNYQMFHDASLWYENQEPVPIDVKVATKVAYSVKVNGSDQYYVRNANRTWTQVYTTKHFRDYPLPEESPIKKISASKILAKTFHTDFIFRQPMTYFATSELEILQEEARLDGTELEKETSLLHNPRPCRKRKHASELDNGPSPKKYKAKNGQAVAVEKPVDNERQTCSSVNDAIARQQLNFDNRLIHSFLLFFNGLEDKIDADWLSLPLWRSYISKIQKIATMLYPALLNVYKNMPSEFVGPIPDSSSYKTNQTFFPTSDSQGNERCDCLMLI
jgi:hypothetical protein